MWLTMAEVMVLVVFCLLLLMDRTFAVAGEDKSHSAAISVASAEQSSTASSDVQIAS